MCLKEGRGVEKVKRKGGDHWVGIRIANDGFS